MRASVVPAEPFRQWLRLQIGRIGIGNVAASIGVSARRVKHIEEGRYWDSAKQKHYAVKNLTTDFVDRALTAFGENINDMYPEEK